MDKKEKKKKKCKFPSFTTILTWKVTQLCIALLVFLIYIVIGAVIFHELEGKATHSIPFTYLNCIYFCVVILSTVGYGDMSPVTLGGRIFFVFYALIGIAITGTAVTLLAKMIIDHAVKVGQNIEKQRIKLLSKLKRGAPTPSNSFFVWKMIKDQAAKRVTLIATIIVLIFTWLISALLMTRTEKWDYGTAVYFCFVSMTTIGLGDYVPQTPGGRAVTCIMIIIGIGVLAIIIGEVGTIFTSSGDKLLNKFTKKQNKVLDKLASKGEIPPIPEAYRTAINALLVLLPEDNVKINELVFQLRTKGVHILMEDMTDSSSSTTTSTTHIEIATV